MHRVLIKCFFSTKSLKNTLCLHCRNEFRLSFPKKQGSTEFKSLISYEDPILKINKLIFSRSDWLVRMVPWFGQRIWVILQLTGAKRFGKQPRSYWILIQWPCDAYDAGGTGARGPVGIVIYLSLFSTDFMWYQFYLRLFIEHSQLHTVHRPMQAHSCVASLQRDHFKVVVWSQIVCHWHQNRKG